MLSSRYTHFELEKVATIGSGTFGTVDICKKKKSPCENDPSLSKHPFVAVKSYVKDRVQGIARRIMNEKRVLSLINDRRGCPYIMRLIDTKKDDQCLFFILEPCLAGPLHLHISRADRGRLSILTARKYFAELIAALIFLAENKCIHRDLKASNIMLNEHGRLKLCDFGCARLLEQPQPQEEPTSSSSSSSSSDSSLSIETIDTIGGYRREVSQRAFSIVGSIHIMAPEMAARKMGYDCSVDMWAAGVLLYEMLVGHFPRWDRQTQIIKHYHHLQQQQEPQQQQQQHQNMLKERPSTAAEDKSLPNSNSNSAAAPSFADKMSSRPASAKDECRGRPEPSQTLSSSPETDLSSANPVVVWPSTDVSDLTYELIMQDRETAANQASTFKKAEEKYKATAFPHSPLLANCCSNSSGSSGSINDFTSSGSLPAGFWRFDRISDKGNQDILCELVRNGDTLQAAALDLLKALLTVDPLQRLSCYTDKSSPQPEYAVLKHPFFGEHVCKSLDNGPSITAASSFSSCTSNELIIEGIHWEAVRAGTCAPASSSFDRRLGCLELIDEYFCGTGTGTGTGDEDGLTSEQQEMFADF